MGKKPIVAPYSGDMLAIVARSASDIVETPVAKELDKFADDFFIAQDFGDGEHQIGRRGAGREFAGELHANHLGHEHVDRLAEHHALGFDAADAPTDDAQAVDHRRVAVGSYE